MRYKLVSMLTVMAILASLCGLAATQAGANSSVSIIQVDINPDGADLAARYEVVFMTSSSGALKSGEDAIHITFPQETRLPSNIKDNSVIVNGKRCDQGGEVLVYDQTLIIYPGIDVEAGHQCTVVIGQSASLVNPKLSQERDDKAITSLYALEVKTDKDEADTCEYQIFDWVGAHPWELAQNDPCTVWGAGFKPGFTIHLNGLSGGPVHGSGKVGADGTFEFVGYATGRADEPLIASEGSGRSAQASENAPHLPVNEPPTASFNYTPQEPVTNGTVAFDSSDSSDPDGSIIAWSWNFGDGAKGTGENGNHSYTTPGDYTVTMTVIDNRNATDTESRTISVRRSIETSTNAAPMANAGSPRTVEQTGPDGAEVTLDGSGSYDPDGDALTFNWTWDGGSVSGIQPVIFLPPGRNEITLTASDGEKSHNDSTVITVLDTKPPRISIVSPGDGESYSVTQQAIELDYTVTDRCDPDPHIALKLDGFEFAGSRINIPDLATGDHTLTIIAADRTGNSASGSTGFSIEAETSDGSTGNLWHHWLTVLKYILLLFIPG